MMIYEFQRVQIVGLCEEWCPNLQASAEQKISNLMHVSGHGMAEWVQRYASAKLSELFGWQGGEFFTGATFSKSVSRGERLIVLGLFYPLALAGVKAKNHSF